jgi:hypothetical protein
MLLGVDGPRWLLGWMAPDGFCLGFGKNGVGKNLGKEDDPTTDF